MITIALDAMGGDHGVGVTVPAALKTLRDEPTLKLTLVGQRDVIEAVRRPGLPAPPDPHAHTPRLLASPGLGPGPASGRLNPVCREPPARTYRI